MATRTRLWPRLGFAWLVGTGFLIAWGCGLGAICSYVDSLIDHQDQAYTLELTGDGEVCYSRYAPHSSERIYSRPDGRRLPDSTPERLLIATSPSPAGDGPPSRLTAAQQAQAVQTSGNVPRFWYLLSVPPEAELWYLVAYDPRTHLPTTWLGRRGRSPGPPPPADCFRLRLGRYGGTGQCFVVGNGGYLAGPPTVPDPDWPPHRIAAWQAFALSGDELLAIDLEAGTVRPLLREPGLASVALWLPRNYWDAEDRESPFPERLAVRAGNSLITCAPDGSERRDYPLPPDLRDRSWRAWETSAGQLILHGDSPTDVARREPNLFRLGPSGLLRAERTEPPNREVSEPSPFESLVVVLLPTPLPQWAGLWVGSVEEAGYSDDGLTAVQYLGRNLRQFGPGLLLTVLLSLLLLWPTTRRQRATGDDHRLLWLAWVAGFGLPGWIGYLGSRRWPQQAVCPSCGKLAPQDRPSCLRCGAPFPKPEKDGSELLD